jgi:hypothetical protein
MKKSYTDYILRVASCNIFCFYKENYQTWALVSHCLAIWSQHTFSLSDIFKSRLGILTKNSFIVNTGKTWREKTLFYSNKMFPFNSMSLTLGTSEMEIEAYVVIMFVNKLCVMKLYASRHILGHRLCYDVLAGYAMPNIWQSSGQDDTEKRVEGERSKGENYITRFGHKSNPSAREPLLREQRTFSVWGGGRKKEENSYHTCKLHVWLPRPLLALRLWNLPFRKTENIYCFPIGKG